MRKGMGHGPNLKNLQPSPPGSTKKAALPMCFFLGQRSHSNPGMTQHWVYKSTDAFYHRSRVETADPKCPVTALTGMCVLPSESVWSHPFAMWAPGTPLIPMSISPCLTVHLGFFLFLGSTSTRNSSQKGSSVLSIKQRSKRELYLEKLQEHLIRAKALTIKKWVHTNTWVGVLF